MSFAIFTLDDEPVGSVIFDSEEDAWETARLAFWDDPRSRKGVRAWLKVCKVRVFNIDRLVIQGA
jgi:hypothetical protein